MLRWALAFLIVSIVAGVLGYGGVAEASSDMAKIIFMIFVVLFIFSSLFYMTGITLELITWAFIFLFIAVAAGALGFTSLAILSTEITKIVFTIFVVLFVLSMLAHLLNKIAK